MTFAAGIGLILAFTGGTDVPAVSDLPVAQGLSVLGAVRAGNQFSSALPGHWQFVALRGPRSERASQVIGQEVRLLARDGWTDAETSMVGTPNVNIGLNDPHRHINVILDIATSADDFPEELWHNRAINDAVNHGVPVVEAQLGTGPHPELR